MKSIGLAIVVAVIVEALVEYGQTIYDMVAEYEYKKAIKQGVSIAVAILFSFQLKVTLITWLMSGNFDVTVSPAFDMIISGLFMSRGANYLADFVRMVLRIGTDDGSIWDAWEDEDEDDETDESEEN
jgi:hypothetical protein